MLHFAHNCLIKGLCKVEDARKIGIPHYISDKTKNQISRGTELWWASKCELKMLTKTHDNRPESLVWIWTPPDMSIEFWLDCVCWSFNLAELLCVTLMWHFAKVVQWQYWGNQQMSHRRLKWTFKPHHELSCFSGPDTMFSGSHAIHLKIF